MDFNALVSALVDHPAAAIAAVELFAIGYLYKESRADSKAAMELALKIAPLADQLAEAVETAGKIALSRRRADE